MYQKQVFTERTKKILYSVQQSVGSQFDMVDVSIAPIGRLCQGSATYGLAKPSKNRM